MVRNCFVMSVLTLFVALTPWIFRFTNQNLTIAVATMGGTVSFIMLLSGIVFALMAKNEKAMETSGAFAHWTYTDDEWQKFIAREHVTNVGAKVSTFKLTVVICAIVGTGYYAMDPVGGPYVALSMVGLVAILGTVALVSVRMARQRLMTKSDAYIGKEGIVFGQQFVSWRFAGSKLEMMTYVESTDPAIVDFQYSVISPRSLKEYYNIRIPVPASQRASVEMLAGKLQKPLTRS